MLQYKIYPSLLDNFQRLCDVDKAFESYTNIDSEGAYKLTYDEFVERAENDLLNAVNRVKTDPSPALLRGTSLNEAIDCLILGKKQINPDIKCYSSKDYTYRTADSNYENIKETKEDIPCIYAEIGGQLFAFNLELCKALRDRLNGSIPQHYCSANLETKYGTVELYGFIDYVQMDRVIDLKTTSQYSFGKYEKGWQKDLYPYCLITSGEMDSIREFEYLAVSWIDRVGKPLDGSIYPEVYTFRYEHSKERLDNMCTHFIEWLELNRDKITDKKIFAQDAL